MINNELWISEWNIQYFSSSVIKCSFTYCFTTESNMLPLQNISLLQIWILFVKLQPQPGSHLVGIDIQILPLPLPSVFLIYWQNINIMSHSQVTIKIKWWQFKEQGDSESSHNIKTFWEILCCSLFSTFSIFCCTLYFFYLFGKRNYHICMV